MYNRKTGLNGNIIYKDGTKYPDENNDIVEGK